MPWLKYSFAAAMGAHIGQLMFEAVEDAGQINSEGAGPILGREQSRWLPLRSDNTGVIKCIIKSPKSVDGKGNHALYLGFIAHVAAKRCGRTALLLYFIDAGLCGLSINISNNHLRTGLRETFDGRCTNAGCPTGDKRYLITEIIDRLGQWMSSCFGLSLLVSQYVTTHPLRGPTQ